MYWCINCGKKLSKYDCVCPYCGGGDIVTDGVGTEAVLIEPEEEDGEPEPPANPTVYRCYEISREKEAEPRPVPETKFKKQKPHTLLKILLFLTAILLAAHAGYLIGMFPSRISAYSLCLGAAVLYTLMTAVSIVGHVLSWADIIRICFALDGRRDDNTTVPLMLTGLRAALTFVGSQWIAFIGINTAAAWKTAGPGPGVEYLLVCAALTVLVVLLCALFIKLNPEMDKTFKCIKKAYARLGQFWKAESGKGDYPPFDDLKEEPDPSGFSTTSNGGVSTDGNVSEDTGEKTLEGGKAEGEPSGSRYVYESGQDKAGEEFLEDTVYQQIS